jgi:hypothetical protein
MRAIVDPARGAKIVSLRDDSGREWLAQAEPGAAIGARFVDAEMAGWDECAPSISACVVDGRQIPDHGDLWDSVFELEGPVARGAGDGYTFSRRIEQIDGGLRLSYRAEAQGGDVPFLWAAHPQFVAPAGSRVEVKATTVIDVLSRDLPLVQFDGSIDSVEAGGCRKVYLQPDESVFEAALIHPDGATLTMRWSLQAPYLGIWFDKRHSREPVIALEPSTGFFDSVAAAAANKRVPTLTRGNPLEWWVELIA